MTDINTLQGMKRRLSIALSAALLLGACAKEAPSGGRQPEPGEGAIRAVAEEVHDGAVSRSSFDENGRVAWSQGDVIGVMTADNTDANLTYRALTETDASQGLFTMEGDITLSGETFYAYYPMVPGNRLGADLTLPVTLPAVQTYRQGSFGPNANISVAVSTDGANYAFKNACGYLDIRLLGSAEDKIGSVEVTAGGAVIAGSGSVDFGGYASGPLFVPDEGGSTTVRLECGDGIALNPASATSFHVVLPAGTYASVGVRARTSDGRSYSYTKSPEGGVVIKRSTVTHFKPSEFFDGIEVENLSGELADRLAGTDASSVTALRITGTLNATDFAYIRENLTALELLDLSGTEMTVFPDRALAFYDDANTTLKEVILPEGLTTIEDAAFANCTALEKLDVPSSVSELGRWILENTAVETFTIPDGVSEIPASCFYGSAITAMVVPSTVTSFASIYDDDVEGDCGWTFVACMQLQSLVIEGPVTTIPCDFCWSGQYDAQDNVVLTNLTSLTLPDEVQEIGAGAFNGCPITALTLPAQLREIGDEAFAYCKLTELVLPEGFTTIRGGAFRNAPLETLDLPSTIEDLDTGRHIYLFNGAGLQTVICRKSTPPALSQLYSPFCDVAHFTFVNETCVLKVPAASVEDYKASDWARYFKIIQAIE